MSRLTEKFIQSKSLEYLASYYEQKFHPKKIFFKRECRLKLKYGAKRADGLLCFMSDKQNEHTVSLEAKSHKTIMNLIPYWHDNRIAIFTIPIAAILGLSTLLLSYSLIWYWIVSIALFTILISWIILVLISTILEPISFKSAGVIRQLEQYSANEKWLAISKDSLNLSEKKRKDEWFKQENSTNLIRICKAKGIGVLVVTRRSIEVILYPKYKSGNFLNRYALDNQIREFLA